MVIGVMDVIVNREKIVKGVGKKKKKVRIKYLNEKKIREIMFEDWG